MYISRKIIDIIYQMEHFVGKTKKDIYYAIKQEIKFNPKYKNIRFMSEQRFYECYELGKKYSNLDVEDCKLYQAIYTRFYIGVKFKLQNYELSCRAKFFDVIFSNHKLTYGQFDIMLKIYQLYRNNTNE